MTGQYLLTCIYNVITLDVFVVKRKAPAPIGVEAEAATPRESLRIEPALRSARLQSCALARALLSREHHRHVCHRENRHETR
jgi:hypothetical protein